MSDTISPPPPGPPPFLPPDQQTRKAFAPLQVKIEVLLIVSFLVIAAIIICGWLRSRISNSILKLLSTKALFPGGARLLTYVTGLMDQTKYSNDLFALWMAFLTYLMAVANSYSCYSLSNNEYERTRLLIDYIFPWGVIVLSLYKNLAVAEVLVPLAVIFWMVVLKLIERRDALNSATRSSLGMVKNTKVIFDFMKESRRYQSSDVEVGTGGNPGLYKYLVGVKEARALLVEPHEDLLSGDPCNVLSSDDDENESLVGSADHNFITLFHVEKYRAKLEEMSPPGDSLSNNCVSFALFWLLLAKITDYEVDEDVYVDVLLSKDPDMTFSLIEGELDFLYQYLFTNNYAVYSRGIGRKLRHFLLVVLFFWLTFPILAYYRPEDHSLVYVLVYGHVLDTGITRFVILAIFLMEFAHVTLVCSSKWSKVSFACAYIQNKLPYFARGPFQKALKFLWLWRRRLVPTSVRQLDQYSLIQQYDRIPYRAWLKCWMDGYIDIPGVGQKGSGSTPFKPYLKEAILSYIKGAKSKRGGKLSNGTNSLREKSADALIERYVGTLNNQTEVIIVWHLATELCEKRISLEPHDFGVASTSSALSGNDYFKIANELSKYCAHLVAFLPTFLPDGDFITKSALNATIMELIEDIDEKQKAIDDPREFIANIYRNREHGSRKKSILLSAWNLAVDIHDKPDLWKLLADFWTEMVLYLAASNKFEAIEAHAAHLCTGGQFLTQLWALLNHAGCSRDRNVKPQNKRRGEE